MSKSGEFDIPITIGAFPYAEPVAQTTSQQTLWQAVHARQAEYIQPCEARVRVGTWNVAALEGTEKDLCRWFVTGSRGASGRSSIAVKEAPENTDTKEATIKQDPAKESTDEPNKEDAKVSEPEAAVGQGGECHASAGSDIDLYVLGLQEIVDINSPAEALRPYTDPGPSQKWKAALLNALPPGFEVVAEQQLVGLLLLVAASPSMTAKVSSVNTTSVGTGMFGYMGNKGAVAARMVLGETTTVVFVNCHLAAGTERGSLERRNWDVGQILTRTRFRPKADESGSSEGSDEGIGDGDLAWWLGDLNYRLEDISGDDVRRLLTLHVRDEYRRRNGPEQAARQKVTETRRSAEEHDKELSSRSSADSRDYSTPATDVHERLSGQDDAASDRSSNSTFDPASLWTTLSSFLPHDQLWRQQDARKVFYEGWREGAITFLPTYKYDVGSVGAFDSSEKKRAPSWCDRILFRTRQDLVQHNEKIRLEANKAEGEDEVVASEREFDVLGDDPDLLFEYDPDTDGADGDATSSQAHDARGDGEQTAAGHRQRLELLSYTSHQEICSSDHKPLLAEFSFSYDGVVPALKKKIHDEVARGLDKVENAERPGVTIVVEGGDDAAAAQQSRDTSKQSQPLSDANTVSFGEVHYAEGKSRTITVANTSGASARLGFLHGSDSDDDLPPWLKFHMDGSSASLSSAGQRLNKEFELAPGDTLNARFGLMVDGTRLVPSLNEGGSKLEHVLVLRVFGGRDYFISVYAEWVPSTFGRSLDELVHLPEGGVRAMADARNGDPKSPGRERRSSVPPAVVSFAEAMDALASRVIAEWSMTEGSNGSKPPWDTHAAWPFAKDSWTLKDAEQRRHLQLQVHEALDTQKPLSSGFSPGTPASMQIEVVAEVLIDFLSSIKDGIVTQALWADIERELLDRQRSKRRASPEDEQLWIFDALSASPVHNVSFVFLTSMLSHVAGELAGSAGEQDGEGASPARSSSSKPHASESGVAASPRRRRVNRAYAEIFAKVLVRASLPAREKDRRGSLERRRDAVEAFLDGA